MRSILDASLRHMGTPARRDSAPAVSEDHPVVQAFRRAPVVPGRPSDEEREAVAAAANGPWISHEEVMAELEARRPR